MKTPSLELVLLVAGVLSVGCVKAGSSDDSTAMAPRTCAFDVAVVGGGPAGIGAAFAASKTGAKTVLVERDARLGGTTVSAEVLPVGLFHAWNRQVIAGPCWDLVTNAVDLAGGVLPDFPKLDARDWRSHCVKVNPFVYSALAAETLEKAGVELWFNAAACGMERTAGGWNISLATDEDMRYLTAKEVVDAMGNASVVALAARRGIDPREVDQEDAKRQLMALGAIVPCEIEAHLAYAHDGISGNQ